MEDSRGDLGVWIESSMYNLLQEEGVNQETVLRKINCKSVFLYLKSEVLGVHKDPNNFKQISFFCYMLGINQTSLC